MSAVCFSWALQQGLYAALNAASAVTVLGSVHDEVPVRAEGDFVALGEETVRRRGIGADVLHTHDVTLVVQSRAGGFARAKALAGAVTGALEGSTLSVAGARVVDLQFERARARRSRGGLRRIELRYRIILENN